MGHVQRYLTIEHVKFAIKWWVVMGRMRIIADGIRFAWGLCYA